MKLKLVYQVHLIHHAHYSLRNGLEKFSFVRRGEGEGRSGGERGEVEEKGEKGEEEKGEKGEEEKEEEKEKGSRRGGGGEGIEGGMRIEKEDEQRWGIREGALERSTSNT